jgi:NADPH:quinone reductase-like Zn-dependent oxidoreductase
MKALVLKALHSPQVLEELPQPSPGSAEVLIQVEAAALNHRDVYITQGLYPGIQLPVILGSDVCGIVIGLGEGADAQWLGQSVIVQPGLNWGDNPRHQSKAYNIMGMPRNGSLAQYLTIPQTQIHRRPAHLSAEEAAALPLAGLTAYRALITRAQAQTGDKVLISGIGGGVALFAFQFALALGLEVYVTSGSEAKIEKALALGARGGFNYRQDDWHKQALKATGGIDVIIDSAGGEGFAKFLDLANFGARIAFYGGTKGNFQVNPQKMFWKQISLYGSTMGSDAEFAQMLQLVESAQIKPLVDSVWPLEKGNEAFQYLDQGQQFGKVVIKP